jgi:hypothetical protein
MSDLSKEMEQGQRNLLWAAGVQLRLPCPSRLLDPKLPFNGKMSAVTCNKRMWSRFRVLAPS